MLWFQIRDKVEQLDGDDDGADESKKREKGNPRAPHRTSASALRIVMIAAQVGLGFLNFFPFFTHTRIRLSKVRFTHTP